jgi:hypothetical protein
VDCANPTSDDIANAPANAATEHAQIRSGIVRGTLNELRPVRGCYTTANPIKSL